MYVWRPHFCEHVCMYIFMRDGLVVASTCTRYQCIYECISICIYIRRCGNVHCACTLIINISVCCNIFVCTRSRICENDLRMCIICSAFKCQPSSVARLYAVCTV
jgi:hypothetical protein